MLDAYLKSDSFQIKVLSTVADNESFLFSSFFYQRNLIRVFFCIEEFLATPKEILFRAKGKLLETFLKTFLNFTRVE